MVKFIVVACVAVEWKWCSALSEIVFRTCPPPYPDGASKKGSENPFAVLLLYEEKGDLEFEFELLLEFASRPEEE